MNKNNNINTVIFDIGNVLANFGWHLYIDELLASMGSLDKRAEVERAIWLSHSPVRPQYKLWDELDIGLMSDEEIIDGFVSHAPACEREIRTACSPEHIGKCIIKLNTAVPWICHVKNNNFRVLFLSNYSKIIMNANPEALDFLPFLDGGIFSCDVHLIKPDLKIYEMLINKYNLEPERCVFIDDIERNVNAAREAGLNAIKLDTHEQARFDLDKFLGIN
ncbi:MAG: HAD family phosphatase [Synergistaceae bacterium]|nr:HAD family phosphatase [Synergistaceae bacterium]